MIVTLILYFIGAVFLRLALCALLFSANDPNVNDSSEAALWGIIGALRVVAARL